MYLCPVNTYTLACGISLKRSGHLKPKTRKDFIKLINPRRSIVGTLEVSVRSDRGTLKMKVGRGCCCLWKEQDLKDINEGDWQKNPSNDTRKTVQWLWSEMHHEGL